jgi:uncharacterized protein (DUF302 family)
MDILYSRMTTQALDVVCGRLEEAVKAHKFGILGVIDLQARMKDKGVDFDPPCRIYEVCNPKIAKQVLDREMAISTALPCRISVYQKAQEVTVATLRPTQVLGLFGAPELMAVAAGVEKDVLAMVDEAVA